MEEPRRSWRGASMRWKWCKYKTWHIVVLSSCRFREHFLSSSTNKNRSPIPWNGADLHYWVQLYPDSANCDNLIHAVLQLTLGKNILKRKKKKDLLNSSTSNLCLPWDDREKMKYNTKAYWIHLPQWRFSAGLLESIAVNASLCSQATWCSSSDWHTFIQLWRWG